MKRPISTVFFALSLATFFNFPAQADSTIIIVRHGEKPAGGLGQLNCQGLNRSLALAPVLLSKYGHPSAIYAPNPAILKKDHGIPYAYVRPLATIEPLAIREGLSVNVEWAMDDIKPLATRLIAASTGTQIVAWEHHWGEHLARLLLSRLNGKPDDVPTWDDTDFDSVYVIRISESAKGSPHATFSHEQEGLNNLPETCSDERFGTHH